GGRVAGGRAAARQEDVADLEPARSRGPAGPDVRDDQAVLTREAERRRHRRRDRLDAHADFLPPQLAVLLDLAEHRPRRRARNREAEPLVATRLRQDERVDADDLAARVDER